MSDPVLAVFDGTEGRDVQTGRFVRGNKAARGNSTPRQTAKFRAQLFKAIAPADFREIIGALLREAKDGNMTAIKLCLQYLAGSPADAELSQRLTAIETLTRG